MDMNLKGKVALVTGASHGLGKAISMGLAAEGAHVGINYIPPFQERAEEAVKEIKEKFGVDALALQGFVDKPADVESMFDQLEEAFGPVDSLVNNAAVCPTCKVWDMDDDMWSDTVRINLTGTFYTCRAMSQRLLRDKRQGHIVNIASQAAFRGSTTGHAPYDASKGGMISFTISLARELGPHGTTVNAIAPGIMHTEMMAKALEKNMDKYVARIPLGRVGQPEEIANVAVFLASDRASYMTGATVDVSAGLAMH